MMKATWTCPVHPPSTFCLALSPWTFSETRAKFNAHGHTIRSNYPLTTSLPTSLTTLLFFFIYFIDYTVWVSFISVSILKFFLEVGSRGWTINAKKAPASSAPLAWSLAAPGAWGYQPSCLTVVGRCVQPRRRSPRRRQQQPGVPILLASQASWEASLTCRPRIPRSMLSVICEE